MAPVGDDRETAGGLEAEPGGKPVSTAAFFRHGGALSTVLWAETGPTKVLKAGEGPRSSRRSPRRRKSIMSSLTRGRGWMVGIGR